MNGTVRTIEYLEQAFSHGQIPTQCDFWDLLATLDGESRYVPITGYSLMTGPLSTNMFYTSCGNSDQWCNSFSTVCANSAIWSDTNFCDKVVYLKNVRSCSPFNVISLTGNLAMTGPITASTVYANCGNSDQWCDAYNVSLKSLTGVSINGVTANYSNHFASFTGLTFGDTATITAINLNGIDQPPDITRTVNLNIPLSSYVPLSGNVTITNPISVDGCITADCITGLTSINLDGGDITNWSDVSAYYDLAGMDILPGDLLHIEYSPSAYDVVTPVPGLTAYPLSGHLAGIDSAMSCISGVSALTFTNTTVAPTPAKTLTNYLLIKVNGSDMYLPLYT